MNADEQARLIALEEQLKAANQDAEETRTYLSSQLNRSATEARFYRGLVWALLAIGGTLAIVSILRA